MNDNECSASIWFSFDYCLFDHNDQLEFHFNSTVFQQFLQIFNFYSHPNFDEPCANVFFL